MTTTIAGALKVRALTPDTQPTAVALANLVDLHQLPAPAAVYLSAVDGHTVADIAVVPSTAQAWRAALGAPEFAAVPHPTNLRLRSEHLWFGALVRLSYTQP